MICMPSFLRASNTSAIVCPAFKACLISGHNTRTRPALVFGLSAASCRRCLKLFSFIDVAPKCPTVLLFCCTYGTDYERISILFQDCLVVLPNCCAFAHFYERLPNNRHKSQFCLTPYWSDRYRIWTRLYHAIVHIPMLRLFNRRRK